METRTIATLVGVVLSLGGTVYAMDAPVAVAPGDADGKAVVLGSCPTFHWSEVDGADTYELALFSLGPDGAAASEIYRVSLPGRVQGWTPTVERCLEPGARYAWALRALGRGGQEGPWSEARAFQIAGAPTVTEVEEALQVLRRWIEEERVERPETDVSIEPVAAERVAPSSAAAGDPTPPHVPHGQTTPQGASADGTTTPEVPANAPVLGAASLTVDQQLHLGAASALFKEGEVLLWEDGAAAVTALGRDSLGHNTTGSNNTAVGALALHENDTGSSNTAVGASALHENVEGIENTAAGYEALGANVSGDGNTAFGMMALHENLGDYNVGVGYLAAGDNTTGTFNTAVGSLALHEGVSGSNNTAIGFEALGGTTSGFSNAALGSLAMHDNTIGFNNSALGTRALRQNVNGSTNVGLGVDALFGNVSGSRNTAVGPRAGQLATTGDDNIYLGSGADGVAAEGHTIRIGGSAVGTGTGEQNRAFINGIRGVTVANSSAVLIDANTGQLGTISSSRRFKRDINDMEEASRPLLALRPVTFRYKESSADGEGTPLEFGLIAEEVARTFPELVVYDKEGRPQTVKYHLLSTLLLNELQQLDDRMRRQEKDIEWLRAKVAKQGVGR